MSQWPHTAIGSAAASAGGASDLADGIEVTGEASDCQDLHVRQEIIVS